MYIEFNIDYQKSFLTSPNPQLSIEYLWITLLAGDGHYPLLPLKDLSL